MFTFLDFTFVLLHAFTLLPLYVRVYSIGGGLRNKEDGQTLHGTFPLTHHDTIRLSSSQCSKLTILMPSYWFDLSDSGIVSFSKCFRMGFVADELQGCSNV